MRHVVGYVHNDRGAEAVRLAAMLAARDAAELDVVVVLPVERTTFDMYSPDRAYFHQLEAQGREWLDEAMSLLPAGTPATPRLVHGETITEGLIEVATDPTLGPEAGLVVIGTSHRGLHGRLTVGSIAGALLHSSPVPVALAPAGYLPQPALTRITCAVGTREGADALLDFAVGLAAAYRVPLRLMSLVALGPHGDAEEQALRRTATAPAATVPAGPPGSAPAGPVLVPPSGSPWRVLRRFVGLTAVNPLTALYFVVLTAGLGDRLGTAAAGAAFAVGVFVSSWAWQLVLAAAGSLTGSRMPAWARTATSLVGYAVVAGYAVHLALG